MKRYQVLHTFSPAEKAVVEKAHMRFLHTVEVIAQIHGLSQPGMVPLPDLDGIGAPDFSADGPASQEPGCD
jgi:hypothetical protein